MPQYGKKTSRHELPLTKDERDHGKKARICMYRVLCGLCPCAGLLTAFAVIIWYNTFAITRAFVASGSLEFLTERELNLYDKLLTLDISSTSALIILLFSSSLFCGSLKIISVHKRKGKEKYSYAYRLRLFPSGIDSICVRLGLIGTLISFVLIALMLFPSSSKDNKAQDEFSESDPTAVVAETTGNKDGVQTADEAEIPPLQQTPTLNVESFQRASQSSFQVFLLLCASLYSTLVGCVFGYFVIPFFEWIAAWATGQQQERLKDPLELQERFLSQVRSMTVAFEQVETMFLILMDYREPADHILEQFNQFSNAVKSSVEGAQDIKAAADSLKETKGHLDSAGRSVATTTEQIEKAAKVSSRLLSHSTSWLRALRKTRRTARIAIQSTRRTGNEVASRIEAAAEKASRELNTDTERYQSTLLANQEAIAKQFGTMEQGINAIAENTTKLDLLLRELHTSNQTNLKNQQATDERLAQLREQSISVLEKLTHLDDGGYDSRGRNHPSGHRGLLASLVGKFQRAPANSSSSSEIIAISKTKTNETPDHRSHSPSIRLEEKVGDDPGGV